MFPTVLRSVSLGSVPGSVSGLWFFVPAGKLLGEFKRVHRMFVGLLAQFVCRQMISFAVCGRGSGVGMGGKVVEFCESIVRALRHRFVPYGSGDDKDFIPQRGVFLCKREQLDGAGLGCSLGVRRALAKPRPRCAGVDGRGGRPYINQASNSLASGKRRLHLARARARSSSTLVSSQFRDMASSLTIR
jgi:hypothetical protein